MQNIWTHVSDKLPEHNQRVCVRIGNGHVQVLATYNDGKNIGIRNGYWVTEDSENATPCRVRYWQPVTNEINEQV